MTFSGSYAPSDVAFLLKPVRLAPTELAEKERLIQSGERHYSEMLGRESPPDETYLALFHEAMRRNRRRLADDVARLARIIASRPQAEVVLVSLARAGTPIGVLLKRTLGLLGRRCVHYSLSIIRDRGIDFAALDFILARHPAESVVFVDGWIGKGAIARELASTVARYNADRRTRLDASLHVVADLAGAAGHAATGDDYLIPCSILNAVISGLISRTVLNSNCVGPGEFHACVYYEEFAEFDLSRWFIEAMMDDIGWSMRRIPTVDAPHASLGSRAERQRTAAAFLEEAMRRYAVSDPNRIKPGLGEATRALLRRLPERLLLADDASHATAHLRWLADRRRVPVERAPWLPYQAAAVIRSLGNDL